jgi:short-subunit dehydrogenase
LVLIAKDKEELAAFARHLKAIVPVHISIILSDLSKKPELKQLESKIAKITDLEILVNCA